MQTDKQQYMDLFITLMIKIIRDDQVFDISKNVFLSCLADQEIGKHAADISKKGYMNEIEPVVTKYFFEVCSQVSEATDLQYHYTSRLWYTDNLSARKAKLASYDLAKKYVVVFGNGRRGRAAGVRFITEKNDKLFTLATATDVDITIKSHDTRKENLKTTLDSGLIEPSLTKRKLSVLK